MFLQAGVALKDWVWNNEKKFSHLLIVSGWTHLSLLRPTLPLSWSPVAAEWVGKVEESSAAKTIGENREKTYFFKKSSRRYLQEAALSLLWILWQFPLVSPLIEEPRTQCQKNAAAWEKVSVLTWNPKQSQQTKKNVWELSFCPSCLRCVQSKLSSWLKTLFPSSTPAWAWETKDGTRGFLFFFCQT